MKKALLLVLCASLVLSGCGQPLHTKEKTYPTYGFFNEDSDKSTKVCYKISVGNIIWSIILIETVIAPIYFIGFDLFNPVRLKNGPDDKCGFDG